VENKIYHKFRNLILHSCWSIVFLCVVSVFILCVFEQNSIWKNILEKKTEKKIGNKKEKGNPSQPPGFSPRPGGLLAKAQSPSP